jgi:chromosome segregation ATPase
MESSLDGYEAELGKCHDMLQRAQEKLKAVEEERDRLREENENLTGNYLAMLGDATKYDADWARVVKNMARLREAAEWFVECYNLWLDMRGFVSSNNFNESIYEISSTALADLKAALNPRPPSE